MTGAGALALGHEFFERQAWADAYAQLAAADREEPSHSRISSALPPPPTWPAGTAPVSAHGLERIASQCVSAMGHERPAAPSGWASRSC
jgi:hypothetical protein